MGVALPSIPISSSEDNINLGDKDSIRRRALWALEGRDSGGSFSVEIPELDQPEVPKRSSFDFRTCFPDISYALPLRNNPASKPSFPPGVGSGFSKRDSKFMASTPSCELLGTLVEEEEEYEEDDEDDDEERRLGRAQRRTRRLIAPLLT